MNRLVFTLFVLCAGANAIKLPYVLPSGYETILRGARNLVENFDCENRPYGYYADVDNGCQIFHICVPVNDNDGNLIETSQFSFVCGNGTIFSQDTLTCAYDEEALPCQEATSIYELANAQFGNLLSNFSVNVPSGSNFIDRVSNAVRNINTASGSNDQFPESSNDDQNTGFVDQNSQLVDPNPQFVDQNSQFVDPNPQFVDQNSEFVDPNPQFVDQNSQSVDSNSDTTNVLGTSRNTGGFSGFSDVNTDIQFS